jgi:uncharacterized delta-60 repeat protein
MDLRRLAATAAAAAAFTMSSPAATAAPGGLDPAFGNAGIARLQGPAGADVANAVAIDAQGRVVTVGYSDSGPINAMAISRHRPDGTLDATFNGSGKRILSGSLSGGAYSVAIDAAGRILVGGIHQGAPVVIRLLADGSNDPAYGTGGIAPVPGANIFPYAMAIDAAGRAVFTGSNTNGYNVARLNADGTPDNTFGGAGFVSTNMGTGEDYPYAIAIDSAGRILVAGQARNGATYEAAVARFLPDGTLDAAFNGTGKYLTPAANEMALGLAVDAADRPVLAIVSVSGGTGVIARRLTAAGVADGTFGTGGRVNYPVGSSGSSRAVSIDSAGRIVLAGTGAGGNNNNALVMARLLANGALDPAFGTAGKAIAAEAGKSFICNAMALDPAGRLVAVGRINRTNEQNTDFGLIRRLPDGGADTAFAGGQFVATGLALIGGSIAAVASQADGKVVFAGALYDGGFTYYHFMVGRLGADGSPDESFGLMGLRVTPFPTDSSQATGVAIDSVGRIVAVGEARGEGDAPAVAVRRYLPDGTPDPGFGTDGLVTHLPTPGGIYVQGVAIDLLDRIVVVGARSGPSQDMLVARLRSDGALDPAFSGGSVLIDFGGTHDRATAVAIDALGRIVLGGHSGSNMAAARLADNGALDTTFNGTGKAVLPLPPGAGSAYAAAMALDAQGRVVLAGESQSVSFVTTEVVARLTAGGVLDPSFGGTGQLVMPAGGGGNRGHAVAVDSANRVLTAGQTFGASSSTSLRRFTEAGAADASFGGSGLVVFDVAADPNSDLAFAMALTRDGRLVAGGLAYSMIPPEMFVLRAFTEESASPFAFTPQAGVAPGATVVSNTITVAGISGAAPISVTGGEYSIGCGGTFTNAPGVVVASATVCVRHRASPLPLASSTTTLLIGTTAGSFTSTTGKAAPGVSLAASANPTAAGSSVTFTATVTGLFGTPTGLVTFRDGTIVIGAASLGAGGQAQLSTSGLFAGARSITAAYGGDALYAAATSLALPHTVNAVVAPPPTRGDANGDRKADLVWRDASGGLALWNMDGPGIVSTFFGVVGTEWQVHAVGDANGDGKSDLFWWNATLGSGYVWFLDGNTVSGFADLGVIGPEWTLAGAGDFNGDGRADALFRRSTDGLYYTFLLNGGTVTAQGSLGTLPAAWSLAGIGDTDGDGKADLVFRNGADGSVMLWKMNGTAAPVATVVGQADAAFWRVAGVGDFDGDGRADLLWQGDDGSLWAWMMNGAAVTSASAIGTLPGPGWTVRMVADFTGDAKADIVWRFVDGTTYLWIMNGAQILSTPQIPNPGGSWQIAP